MVAAEQAKIATKVQKNGLHKRKESSLKDVEIIQGITKCYE